MAVALRVVAVCAARTLGKNLRDFVLVNAPQVHRNVLAGTPQRTLRVHHNTP